MICVHQNSKIVNVNSADKTSPAKENLKIRPLDPKKEGHTIKSLTAYKNIYDCPQNTSGNEVLEGYNSLTCCLTTFTQTRR